MKPKPHTFAEMEHVLTGAQVGDTVSVVLTLGHKPTRYRVIDEDGDTLYLQGVAGAECKVIVAAAERTVWLERLSGRSKRNRRVVQVTVEHAPKQQAQVDLRPVVERLQAEFSAARSGTCSEIARLQAALDGANARLSASQRDAVERSLVTADRDACRLALSRLYNVAHGSEPGTGLLPYDVSPSTVVIDVMAAMLWHSRAPENRPIRVPPMDPYRAAISKSLPGRMQNEKHGERP